MPKSKQKQSANPESIGSENEANSFWWAAFSLFFLNLAIYGQVLGFGLIDGWDDYHYFVERELLESWLSAGWWERVFTPDVGYPSAIPAFLYFLIHQLPEASMVPTAHGMNLLFHLVNVALVYTVAARWLDNQRAAWGVALLWSAHPLLAESVAWVTNLKSLGASTALLALLVVWHRFLNQPTRARLLAAGGLFILGLGFKPSAVIAIPLLAILSFVVKPQVLKRLMTVLFLLVTGAITAVYLHVVNEMHRELIIEKAGFEPEGRGLGGALTEIGGAFFLQMRNAAAPVELHPMYFSGDLTLAMALSGWLLLTALLAYTFWSWRKYALATPGMLLFWLSYFPASGVEQLPRFTADTYAYLPLFGLIWSGAGLLLQTHILQTGRAQRLTRPILIAVVLAFGLTAFSQTGRWQNSSTLWKPVLEANPTRYVPYQLVAQIYFADEEFDTAAQILRAGVQYYDDPGGDRIMALAYALEEAGRPYEALRHMLRILGGEFPAPDQAPAHTIYLLVGYDLPLPEGDADRELCRNAAMQLLQNPHLPGADARRIGEYFHRHGEPGIARAYSMHTQTVDGPDED